MSRQWAKDEAARLAQMNRVNMAVIKDMGGAGGFIPCPCHMVANWQRPFVIAMFNDKGAPIASQHWGSNWRHHKDHIKERELYVVGLATARLPNLLTQYIEATRTLRLSNGSADHAELEFMAELIDTIGSYIWRNKWDDAADAIPESILDPQ